MRVNILKGTYLEFEKMKKKKVLIIALLFTLVTIVWTIAVSNNFYSRGETSPSDMWLYGLTSIAQINALLSPIFLSITASKVSEIVAIWFNFDSADKRTTFTNFLIYNSI